MSWNKVQEALMEAAVAQLAAAGLPAATHVEWPNKHFTPPTDNTPGFNQAVWARVHYLPNPSEPVTMGMNGKDEANGILQIDLNQPPNTGDSEIRAAAILLENYFTAGRVLSKDGQDVTVSAVGRIPGRTVASTHYRVSVNVSWYARVTRQTIS